MPSISMFYGIVIYLYFFDNDRHHTPHIHAKYQGQEAVFAIDTGELITGSLPISKNRLVQAWIELRRDELIADWELAVEGKPPYAIEPLR